jgi:DNA-binding NarL/FixJ family response regulator
MAERKLLTIPLPGVDRLLFCRPAGSHPSALERRLGMAGWDCAVQEAALEAADLAPRARTTGVTLAIVDTRLLLDGQPTRLHLWRQAVQGLKLLLLEVGGEHLTGETALEWLRIGVHGLVPGDLSVKAFHKAVESVLRGELWFSRRVLEDALAASLARDVSTTQSSTLPGSWSTSVDLTPREDQMLNLLLLGLSNKTIARRLDVSPETVKKTVARIYRKFGIHSRGQLIARLLG